MAVLETENRTMCRDLKKIEKAMGKMQWGVWSTLVAVVMVLLERVVR